MSYCYPPNVWENLTESEKKAELFKQHSHEYYIVNFYKDNGIIRRHALNENHDDNAVNGKPFLRHIELIKVLKYFTGEVKMKFSDYKGEVRTTPVIYYAEDTFCCCGEKSSLYICEHTGTGKKFYLGSKCIQKFDPNFDENRGAGLKNGLCIECNTPLRCKTNNIKGILRNYSTKKDDNTCFDCDNKEKEKRREQLKRELEEQLERERREQIEREVLEQRERQEKQRRLEQELHERLKQAEKIRKERDFEKMKLEQRKKWVECYIPFGDPVYKQMMKYFDSVQHQGKCVYTFPVIDGILPKWLKEYKIIKFEPNNNRAPTYQLDGVKLILYNGKYITNKKLGKSLIPPKK